MAQQGVSLEIDEIPGVLVSPGNHPIILHVPTILEIKIPLESDLNKSLDGRSVPSTPPPTPASATAITSDTPSRISRRLSKLVELGATSPTFASFPSLNSPGESSTSNLHDSMNLSTEEFAQDSQSTTESPKTVDKACPTVADPIISQREFSTNTSK